MTLVFQEIHRMKHSPTRTEESRPQTERFFETFYSCALSFEYNITSESDAVDVVAVGSQFWDYRSIGFMEKACVGVLPLRRMDYVGKAYQLLRVEFWITNGRLTCDESNANKTWSDSKMRILFSHSSPQQQWNMYILKVTTLINHQQHEI